MGLIYKVTNKLNGKLYVGQTKFTLEHRKDKHYGKIDDGTYFHNALKKYKDSDFVWEILTECTNIDLDVQEIYWIKYWESFGNDNYNLTLGGQGHRTDDKVYDLVNIDGRTFNGTHAEFYIKYKLYIYPLIENVRKSVDDWMFSDTDTKKIQKDINKYHFKHKDGTEFKGLRSVFIKKFKVDSRYVYTLIKKKNSTRKGWTIINLKD